MLGSLILASSSVLTIFVEWIHTPYGVHFVRITVATVLPPPVSFTYPEGEDDKSFTQVGTRGDNKVEERVNFLG